MVKTHFSLNGEFESWDCHGGQHSSTGKSETTSYSERERPLFHPFETMRLSNDESLIIAAGVPNVIRALRMPYYKMSDLWSAEISPGRQLAVA